ncbi:MAG TPA: DUF6531 domain-containing protein, partial [Thermoanaerobaculia bacterium]|nr:DUF6531 domain-containing protein [Thermoanaerobaculia bacterium]
MRVRFAVAVLAFLISAAQSYASCSDIPKITVSFSETAEGGLVAKIVEENAPYIYITYRGPTTNRLSDDDDTIYYSLGRYCMSGPEQFKVEGRNLYSDCEPAVYTTMIAPLDTTPQLTPVAAAGDASAKVVFPNSGGNGGIGSLKITLFDGENNPGVVKRDGQASDGVYSAYSDKGGSAVFVATSCGDKVTELAVPFEKKKECDDDCQNGGCKDCVGQPVSVISGNMRATDVDPVAGFDDVIPLRRTYDSLATLDGVFGARWSSLFDASLRVHPAVGGGDWLTIIGEDGKQFVFRSAGGGYRQMVPSGPRRQTSLERYADGSWGHVDRDRQLVRLFDSSGRAVAYRNTDTGREVRITWTAGVPVRIEDSWQAWAYAITTDPTTGYITAIAPDGHPGDAWTYTYTADRLIAVQSPIGTWRSYSYPWNGQQNRYERLSVVKNGAGHVLESHQYDAYGRALTSLQDADDITAISAAQAGRVTGEMKVVVTYKTGRQETYYRRYIAGQWRVVEVSGGCASCERSAVVTFDAKGNVLRSQGADGYITLNQYDQAGKNVVRRTTGLRPVSCDPATATDRCRLTPDFLELATSFGNSTASTITEYEYADLVWSERPTLITTLSVLGAADRRTEALTYNPHSGEVLTRTVSGWTGEPRRLEVRTTTTVLYDGAAAAEFAPGGSFDMAWLSLPQPTGARRKVDGPLSGTTDSTAFVYYPIHTSVPAQLRGRLAATRNPAGQIARFEDYDVHGNARRVIDPNGVAESRTYDALGRVTATTLEGGGAGCNTTADPLCAVALTTTRSYNGAGPLKTETTPGGGVTLYEYDERARVSAVSRGTSANDLRERMETNYDPLTGRKSVEKMLARENGAWILKRQTSYRYDTSARLDRVTNADQTTVDYTYDGPGQLRSIRDENHSSPNTFYDYDAAGRVTEVRQVLATAPGGFATTLYTYDLSGNLTSVTDPNSNVTTYVYDDFGQMLKQTSPVTGVTTYEYDIAGRLVRSTDANNAVTTRTYDVLGRVLTTVATRGTVSETSTSTYDTAPHGIGRLSSMTDSTGTTTYSYERRGLLQREEKTISGSTYVTAFQYDRDGNRSAIAYPSGRAVAYTFDYAGRPYSASTGTTPLVTSAKYLPFGPQTELVLGNGTRRTATYDQRYRPLTNALTGPAGPLAQYAYTHDAAGNVKSILDQRDHGYDRTFEYDDLNRLVVANSGSALWGNGSYTYDAMGNMLSSALGPQSQSFLYRGVTPLLDTVTTDGVTRSVTYDAVGNETSWTSGNGLYSPRNRLQATDTFAYGYDARGVRTVTEIATSAQLAGLTVSPAQFRGGDSVQATVTLTAPAPAGGAVVRISGPPRGVHVPPFVTVPAGATFTTFSVSTDPVSVDTSGTLVATRASTYKATITMRRSCALAQLSVVAATVTGGATL